MNKKILLKLMLVLVTLLSVTACGAFKEEFSKYDEGKYYGEWYDETAGYFVFDDNNNFKWYKDKSKSEDNVYKGTWEVEVIKHKSSGETFPYIILDRKVEIVDGVKTILEEATDNRNKTPLVVTEYNKTEMSVLNGNTVVPYDLVKQ